jgi:prolyl-tRNA editing enzyme YbaK/EbsC (Cys-tRNA(Pro) deacylase)
MKLGTLEFAPATERPELLAGPVFAALQNLNDSSVGVAEIDPTLSDTAAFCAQYQVGVERAANCVVLEAKRGERSWFAACVILASTRADVNGVVRRTLDARKVSFAPMEAAVAQSGMEFGAITPVGLPAEWVVLVDKAVADSESVIIGSGIRKLKLLVPGNFFAQLPNVQIVEGLAGSKA